MNGSRLSRLAPLSGLVFVILLAAGAIVINNYDYLPAPEKIRSFYEDAATRVAIGAYVAILSAFFLVWFAGSLRSALRPAEGGTGRLSAVAFGGGVAAGALVVLAYAAVSAAAARAGADSGITADTATALHDFQGMVSGEALPVALAVMVGATAVVSFRTRIFATWLSWVSAIVAVGLLTPIGYVFLLAAVLWIVVVAVILTLRERTTQPTAAGGPVSTT